MRVSIEKRWAKMEQKLFIVAFVLHPARHMKHFDTELQQFVHGVQVASYATDLYQRFFQPADNAELDHTFLQMASYIAKTDSFSASLQRYSDTALHPITFLKLMSLSAPRSPKLASHMFSWTKAFLRLVRMLPKVEKSRCRLSCCVATLLYLWQRSDQAQRCVCP